MGEIEEKLSSACEETDTGEQLVLIVIIIITDTEIGDTTDYILM